MNNFYKKKIISLALARAKNISKELKKEFSRFISTSDSLEDQAIYLLETKKFPISKVVEDLFHIPIAQQENWEKSALVKVTDETADLELNYKTPSYQVRTNFKDWKQENGFDSIPLEIGDIHTVIHFRELHSAQNESYFQWFFNRARYGIRGWGNVKLLKDLQNSLLDNNNNPGWAVRNFLQENQITHIVTDQEQESEEATNQNALAIPNPLNLSSRDSHSLLFMLLGHPFLYYQDQTTTLANSLETLDFYLAIYPSEDHYLAIGLFKKKDSSIIQLPTVSPDKEKHTLLFGNPRGLIYDNQYYRVNKIDIGNYMLVTSFAGVHIPKNEWTTFTEQLKLYYPALPYQIENKVELDYQVQTRNVHNWQFWLKPSEVTYNLKTEKPVKISLNKEIEQLNSNCLLLDIENKEQLDSANFSFTKTPKTYRLFETLKNLVSNESSFSIENHTVSKLAMLLRNYPHAYGFDGQPMISNKDFYFRLRLTKGDSSENSHLLQGEIGSKDEKGEFILLSPQKTTKLQIIGGTPAFLLYQGQLHRIRHMISTSLITATLNGVTINTHEISDFYSTALPYLKQRDIDIYDPEGMLHISSLFHYRLQGHMTIREIEGMLIGRMDTTLITEAGSFPYPFKNSFNEFEIIFQKKRYSIPCDPRQEQKIQEALQEVGWVEEDDGSYAMRQEHALNFVLQHLRHQDKNNLILYYGEKNLKRWKTNVFTPSISVNIKTNIDWFDVDVQIDLDSNQLELQKLLQLWKSGQQAIDNGEKGITIIDQAWLNRYSPILNRLSESNLETKPDSNKLKTQKYNISLLHELEQAAQKKKADTQWYDNIQNLTNTQKLTNYPIPSSVKATLRDYQKNGVNWLCLLYDLGFGGILADDMGLGKTLQTLSFLAIIKEKHGMLAPNLVIAPTSVVTNWQAEAEKFTPHFKTVLLHGHKRQSYYEEAKQADLIITTYSLLQRDLAWLASIHFNVIILDEAQNIKNANTKTTQAVMQLTTKHRLTLTGTPIENSVMELWSQFQFLMPGFFGTMKEFKHNYIQPRKRTEPQDGISHTLLQKQIRPFILRRLKQDVASELPPKTQQILYCEMGEEQKKLYDLTFASIQQQIKQKLPLAGNQFMIFDSLLKLRQICCDPRLSPLSGDNPPESAKFKLFMETLVNVVNEGHRVLVFSQFVKMLTLMHASLEKENIRYLQLDGSIKNRAEVVKKFQESDTYPVFLISLKAGGTGINLTAADYVFHYDPWWNPAIEEQATDRAYRIGQKNQLIVYKLITRNSIEEKIIELQEKKQSVAKHIVKPTDNLENILNLEDIKAIFSL